MSDIVIRKFQVPVASLTPGTAPLRIIQLSDFHFRWWTSLHDRLQHRLSRLEFDLLALTGDFCQHPGNYQHVSRLLRRFVAPFDPPLGCYAVPGNHDPVLLSEQFTDGDPRFLRNESITIHRDGQDINLAGVDDGWRSMADLPKTLANCNHGHPTILLSHIPSTILHLPRGTVDVVLSGHTHGGQWRIPFWGSVIVNDRITRAQTRGLHRIGERWLHVSAGVGASGPFPFRVNCPAEITLLTLVPERSDELQPSARQQNHSD